MSRLNLILLLALAACNGVTTDEAVNCNKPDSFGDSEEGTLLVTAQLNPCVIDAGPNSKALMIKTDDLTLNEGDSLKVSHTEEGELVSTILTPPFDKGYLFLNVAQPRLEFNFANSSSKDSYKLYFRRYAIHENTQNIRCVPNEWPFKGIAHCQKGSDLKRRPTPLPKVIETGLSVSSVFFLSIFMLIIGALATLCAVARGPVRDGPY